ncbi:PLAC8-domain-containing protein [Lentithecium fluviatile CBS 122367]|uniref:PLAC8-domain-containing protein n=1 Tax=Lentithecium fluviatile CBS 122367 TaxID=1168545 RepID=A0A6G1IZT5_9PLEO|nr:PLAC8-domain-containing protein [Lentithecium fluviatile CBS 122367]
MSSGGVIDKSDVQDWKQRLNKSIETKAWGSSTKGPTSRQWSNGFWGCFSPPSLCCLTCCVPCVTFGKTHHRLRKNGDMQGYEPINTSCLLFCASSYFGVNWILNAMQLQDLREKYNLEGSCTEDLVKSYCCLCCSIVQAEKESKEREIENRGVVNQQYASENMVMGQPGQSGQQVPQV